MPNFETFRRPTPAPSDGPTLTVGTSGTIHLNKAAVGLIGGPQLIELLCDPQAQIIGLRPAPDSPDSYALNTTRDGGGAQVNAQRFLDHYSVGGDYRLGAKRYPAYLDGDILCADLSQPGAPTTSNRRIGYVMR